MLTSEQQKDIEQAILEYFEEKGYQKTKEALLKDS